MSSAVLSQYRIMVIDDQMYTRKLITGILRDNSASSIIEAEEGAAALKMLRAVAAIPHVIVCDVNMEPMGGLEFVKKLREFENPAVRKVPVIFLTGDARADVVAEAIDMAVEGFILKPVTPVKLVTKIKQVLGIPG
jgi:two-component system chemotaxis response regulator CheY